MLYIKNNTEIGYFLAEPFGDVYYDLYNFSSMSNTPNALRTIIDWQLNLYGFERFSPDRNARYILRLDFLSNIRTESITQVIEKFVNMLDTLKLENVVIEDPLEVQISNLRIEDAVNLIQNEEFQAVNNAISSLHSSTWRLSIQDIKN